MRADNRVAIPKNCENRNFPTSLSAMTAAVSIGNRIRTLRESAGLKAFELANALDLDPSAVSLIEKDQRSVKAVELAEIAKFLGVSQLSILEPESLLGRLPVSARVGAAEGLAGDTARRLTQIAELHQVLEDGGHPSRHRLDGVPQPAGAKWLDHASRLAKWALERLEGAPEDDDPFTNLVEGIEGELGIDVLVEDLGEGGPLGASITDPSYPLIVVNSSQPRPRALFTLGHELGHVLNRDGTSLNIDSDLRAHNDEERTANAFAAALLMPELSVKDTIESYGRGSKSLGQMLLDFGVSFESLIFRLHNLRIINAGGRDNLRSVGWAGLLAELEDHGLKQALLAARGSRPERRPPVLLAARCLAGIFDGTVSAAPLAGLLDIDTDELLNLVSAIEADGPSKIDGDYSTPADAQDDFLRGFDLSPV